MPPPPCCCVILVCSITELFSCLSGRFSFSLLLTCIAVWILNSVGSTRRWPAPTIGRTMGTAGHHVPVSLLNICMHGIQTLWLWRVVTRVAIAPSWSDSCEMDWWTTQVPKNAGLCKLHRYIKPFVIDLGPWHQGTPRVIARRRSNLCYMQQCLLHHILMHTSEQQ